MSVEANIFTLPFSKAFRRRILITRTQWLSGERRGSVVFRLLGSADSNPAGSIEVSLFWVFCVLSGRNLCDGPILRPEESYRLWWVTERDKV
jgi:hypothetical protein